MRGTAAAVFNDYVEIWRYVQSDDGFGATTTTWTLHETVPGTVDVDRTQGREGDAGGREMAISRWMITVGAETDVTEKDRLVVNDRTYEIIQVYNRQGMEIARRVLCESRE